MEQLSFFGKVDKAIHGKTWWHGNYECRNFHGQPLVSISFDGRASDAQGQVTSKMTCHSHKMTPHWDC